MARSALTTIWYLDFLGATYEGQPLSAAITEQTESALAALAAIEQSLSVAVVEDPDAVRTLYDEVKALLVLVKSDMANHLGITITFSDNDGD